MCMHAETIFMQLAPRWVANIFMEKLPAPNLTSTAGSKLPSTRIPNHNPHLRSAMSDSSPSGDTSYVLRGSHITVWTLRYVWWRFVNRKAVLVRNSPQQFAIKRQVGCCSHQTIAYRQPTLQEKSIMEKFAYQICVAALSLFRLEQGIYDNRN